MSHLDEIQGPEFLEQYAARLEANGFDIEASLMRKRAREWSFDRQAIANGPRTPINLKPGAGKAFNATLLEADFGKNRLIFEPESNGIRVGAGRYHLIPVSNVA